MIGRLIAAGAAVGLVVGLSGCASTSGASAATRITVASEHCGDGWTDPRPGQQTFLLANSDIVTGEVFLVDGQSGAVYAYVDNVAPGATALLRVDLGSGHYSFRCAMSDEGVARGAQVTIPGNARGGSRPVQAVTDETLVPIAKKYDSWVASQLPGLVRLVTALDADLRSGDLNRARADWLPAHLDYERLGAAYGAFGETDTAINGLTTGLAGGVADPRFTGFHRIEYGLWHGHSAAALAPIGAGLLRDVRTLQSTIASSSVATLDLAIRSHEIAENALQFDLTGETDFGSGSSLASVSAELEGTTELLDLMTPVLASRYPDLGTAESALSRARRDVSAEFVAGAWTSLESLGRTSRERIDADLSGLSALLAPIASIAEPRIDS
ncbi:MAG TPA: EfeM/EfeO family lipoprotein [Galbitalea sp.]|jgi:iron uptake system component EfeO|nr:EfeM/EfeO family lipoprotein [Galbitalea sp.]